MRGLYIKYGIRLLLLAGIAIFFLFFFEGFNKKQTLFLVIFLLYMLVRIGMRFWNERDRLKIEMNQEEESKIEN